MKTPWSSLLQYGVAVAAIVVISIATVGLLVVVGLAAMLAKILVFIK